MKHFYFIEENTGEEFLVGAHDLNEAMIIAKEVAADIASGMEEYPSLSYEYEMTDDEAEASGLDEF